MSTLNVRINHKYDTYARWMQSTIVLGKGEIAVCEIPSGQEFTEPDGSTHLTPPAIGVKIGDGDKTFAQLPWIQSTAGDVYAWAKAADKPEYKAEEIKELETFINNTVQDTNTQYQFAFAGDTLTIKSKEKTDADFSDYATLTINLSGKVDKVAGVSGNLVAFAADGAIADSGEKIGDFLKSADAASTYATITDLDAVEETVADHGERLGAAEGKLTTLIGSDADKSVRTIANEELAKQLIADGAAESLDTLQEIAQWIQDHPGDAAEMNEKIAALEGTLGDETTGLVKDVADNAAAIDTLEGASHTHENKAVLDGITAEKVAAWDAAGGDAKTYVDEAIAVETQAREAADTAFDGRLTTVEGLVGKTAEEGLQKKVADAETAIDALEDKAHEHANKDVLDGVTADKVATWDKAVQSVSGLVTTKTGTDVAVTAVPVNLLANVEGDTLVFECGNSGVATA